MPSEVFSGHSTNFVTIATIFRESLCFLDGYEFWYRISVIYLLSCYRLSFQLGQISKFWRTLGVFLCMQWNQCFKKIMKLNLLTFKEFVTFFHEAAAILNSHSLLPNYEGLSHHSWFLLHCVLSETIKICKVSVQSHLTSLESMIPLVPAGQVKIN